MKRFNARLIELRKRGAKTAVGMAGNTYRRRVYMVVVVDEHDCIVTAEQFGGWTVFAHLKPVPSLVRVPIQEIGTEHKFGIKPKYWQALCNAVHYIRQYDHEHASEEHETKSNAGVTPPTGWKVGENPERKTNV